MRLNQLRSPTTGVTLGLNKRASIVRWCSLERLTVSYSPPRVTISIQLCLMYRNACGAPLSFTCNARGLVVNDHAPVCHPCYIERGHDGLEARRTSEKRTLYEYKEVAALKCKNLSYSGIS